MAKEGSVPVFGILVRVVAALAILGAVGGLWQRRHYPHGNFLVQKDRETIQEQNPDLLAITDRIQLGKTTKAQLLEKLEPPIAMHQAGRMVLLVFRSFKKEREQRMLLGILPIGEGTHSRTTDLPIAFVDGVVVHTTRKESSDPAVRTQFGELWGEHLRNP